MWGITNMPCKIAAGLRRWLCGLVLVTQTEGPKFRFLTPLEKVCHHSVCGPTTERSDMTVCVCVYNPSIVRLGIACMYNHSIEELDNGHQQ